MGKLIVVSRDRVEASHRRLEELLAKDPRWQEEKKELERWEAEEKARRDAEYAAKRPTHKEAGKGAK
jgi:hypothetical protein